MILVMYNPEQNALRLFNTHKKCWVDMEDIFNQTADLVEYIAEWNWQLIGEL